MGILLAGITVRFIMFVPLGQPPGSLASSCSPKFVGYGGRGGRRGRRAKRMAREEGPPQRFRSAYDEIARAERHSEVAGGGARPVRRANLAKQF